MRAASAVVTLAASVLLAACGGGDRAVQRAEAPADSAAKVGVFLEQAYSPATRAAVTETRERWFDGADALDVAIVAPATPTRTPIVVYLPGLGENALAGALWRKPWAEAGYAVLSLQPERVGEAIGRTPRARAGDFRGLAQEAFGTTALEDRVALVRRALAEVSRRASTGLQPYASMDTTRVVFAGFHLGAQAAAALGAASGTASGASARGVVLIGPVVAAPASAAIPRLVVTATAQEDPYGYVPRAGMREGAASGARYVLTLAGGSHAMLSGSSYSAPGQARDAISVPERRDGRRPADDRFRALGAAPRDPFAADQVNRPQPQRGLPRLDSIPFDPKQMAAVIAVTTAFLDESLRERTEAGAWLAREAQGWLGRSATLRSAR